MDIVPQKKCSGTCKQWHPATNEYFHRNKSKADGLNTECKTCKNNRSKEYDQRSEVREKRLPRQKEWNDSHKDYHRDYIKTYKETHKDEISEQKRDYLQRNRERIHLRHQEHYKRNRTAIKARHKRHYQINKERFQEHSKRRYRENIEYYRIRSQKYIQTEQGRAVVRAAIQKYRQTERGKLMGRVYSHKRRALEKSIPGSFTRKDIESQYRRQKGRCYYCHKKVGQRYQIDHIVPITREGTSNWPDNLVITCPPCNASKNNRMPHGWPRGGRLL